jgi:hypothetical protein
MISLCRSTMSSLFLHSSPLAIVWRVVSIVVDAINGQTRVWLTAHVDEKVSKVAPSLANLNAPTAIVLILIKGRIITAIADFLPCSIFRRSECRFPMLADGSTLPFKTNASTRGGKALLHVSVVDDALSPAIASDQPAGFFVANVDERKNRQASKFLTRDVFAHPATMARRMLGVKLI